LLYLGTIGTEEVETTYSIRACNVDSAEEEAAEATAIFAREGPWGQSGRASFVPACDELVN
jgi:hypothetical protein